MGKISDTLAKGKYSLKVQQTGKCLLDLSGMMQNDEARDLLIDAHGLYCQALNIEGRDW